MTPLRRRDLAVLAGGLAVAAWLLVRATYGVLPRLDWWQPVPLGVLALAEALGARVLGARLAAERDRRSTPGRSTPGRPASGRPASGGRDLVRPVEPMLVARLAVLAQASAYLGAVFLGIWVGVLAHVVPAVGRLQAASGDAVTGLLGVVCAAGLVAAALWLEQVCRVPPDPSSSGGHRGQEPSP